MSGNHMYSLILVECIGFPHGYNSLEGVNKWEEVLKVFQLGVENLPTSPLTAR